MGRAACADSATDFYDYTNDNHAGETGESLNWAALGVLVETCRRCPVIVECARFAMRQGAIEQHGVWAGTTGTQRIRAARSDDPVGNVLAFAKENVAEARRRVVEARKREAQLQLEGVA